VSGPCLECRTLPSPSAARARNLRGAILILSLAALWLCGSGSSHAQSPEAGFWDVEKLAEHPASSVNLRKQEGGQAIATIQVSRVRSLRDVKRRIENEAGFGAAFSLTDEGMPSPNAFSTVNDKGAFVALNLAMLDLLGDDIDALAAVVGHEYAHLALKHREARQTREVGRQVLGTIIGILLGRVGVPMGGTISDLGTAMVSRTFSREEEREADEKGMRYAAAAGFSAEGGIRAWERMAGKNSNRPAPFMATHPAPEERIANMRELAQTIPRAAPQTVASMESPSPGTATVASLSAVLAAVDGSEVRWSFAGREFVSLRGTTFVEDSGRLRVFDVASEAEPVLKIGDSVRSCTDTLSPIATIEELLECRSAEDAQVMRITLVRDVDRHP
jgi:hypothetical protein